MVYRFVVVKDMKEKLEGDALFFHFIFKVVRLIGVGILMVIFMGFVFAEGQTQVPPPHVCEVTSADLKAFMVVVDKKLTTRDNQIEGLKNQLYKKQGVGR